MKNLTNNENIGSRIIPADKFMDIEKQHKNNLKQLDEDLKNKIIDVSAYHLKIMTLERDYKNNLFSLVRQFGPIIKI